MKVVIVAFLCAVLAACASSGRNFSDAGFIELQPGKTTVQEATEYLGAKPHQVIYPGDGTQHVQWLYVHSNGLTSETKVRSAVLIFDQNDRFIRAREMVNVAMTPELRKKLNPVSVQER